MRLALFASAIDDAGLVFLRCLLLHRKNARAASRITATGTATAGPMIAASLVPPLFGEAVAVTVAIMVVARLAPMLVVTTVVM